MKNAYLGRDWRTRAGNDSLQIRYLLSTSDCFYYISTEATRPPSEVLKQEKACKVLLDSSFIHCSGDCRYRMLNARTQPAKAWRPCPKSEYPSSESGVSILANKRTNEFSASNHSSQGQADCANIPFYTLGGSTPESVPVTHPSWDGVCDTVWELAYDSDFTVQHGWNSLLWDSLFKIVVLFFLLFLLYVLLGS